MSARTIASPNSAAARAAHEAYRDTLQQTTYRIIAGPPGTAVGTLIIQIEAPRKAR